MLTNSEDISYAEQITERILSHNKETFVYEGREIPLSLYAGVIKFGEGTLKYNDLFQQLHSAIEENK